MTDLTEYVARLKVLKSQSMAQYQQTMDSYKNNYPEFYAQLVKSMNEGSTTTQETRFKMFFNEYKWYLVAIGVGLVVIGTLMYFLFI